MCAHDTIRLGFSREEMKAAHGRSRTVLAVPVNKRLNNPLKTRLAFFSFPLSWAKITTANTYGGRLLSHTHVSSTVNLEVAMSYVAETRVRYFVSPCRGAKHGTSCGPTVVPLLRAASQVK
jgi:hypothetical protein